MNATPQLRAGHFCVFIPTDAFVEGKGWRVSIVVEDEVGHFPTGGDGTNGQQPWYWGRERGDYAEAVAAAEAYNAKIGLTKRDVDRILFSSHTFAKALKGAKNAKRAKKGGAS